MQNAFKKRPNDNFCVYHLAPQKWKQIKNFLSSKALSCFLNTTQLRRLNERSKKERQEELREFYFPDRGNIKSGDFGEIFSFYFLKSEFQEEKIKLFGPKKWKWKDSKNKAAPGADVLLFSKDPKNTKNDILLSVESKMAATKPRPDKNRLQDAIDGAIDDRVSRMARTVDWLKEKYHKEGRLDQKMEISRFSNPVDTPYIKKHFAIAIFDSSFCNNELEKNCDDSSGIEVYAIAINDLKKMYEAFFEDAINDC